jgi:hypothetical protein
MRPRAAHGRYAEVRRFLTGANLRPDFAARVLARIHAEHDRRGTSFLHATLLELVRECSEEAEDLAAWAALTTAHLHQGAHKEHTFADRRARALLTAVTQRAGEADVLLCELRRVLERPA